MVVLCFLPIIHSLDLIPGISVMITRIILITTAVLHLYRDLGDKTWNWMGFYDAFNERRDWWATSYLAIDQGPIILMIENYRSQLLWDLFMSNPEIQPMMDAIGFTALP